MLAEHRLDILVAAFDDRSPALKSVGFRPYGKAVANDTRNVLAIPPGENAWAVAIDRALHGFQQDQSAGPNP